MSDGKAADNAADKASWDDRRDSARVTIRLMVRDLELGGSYEERDGNLALGGVYFTEGHPPAGNRLELRFFLPGSSDEIRVQGEVVQVTREGSAFGAHVRFADMPIETELAIARSLEGR